MFAGSGMMCGVADDQMRHAGARVLRNDNIVVEIMDPNHDERYYRGARFSPVAAVLRATAGGHEYLNNPIEHDAMTEHAGLPCEFDLSTPPPGHAEAADGEGFVKIGVGVLKKKGAQYAFWNAYEIIEPARMTVKWGKDSASFRQVCSGVNGYAYELTADVALDGPGVTVKWTLKNTGEKKLVSNNYVHNFFRFDDRNVGPEYVLSFPYDYTPTGLGEEQSVKGREIHFEKEIPKWINAEVPYPAKHDGANSFELRHTGDGLWIKGATSIPGTRTALHATRTHVCPEQFVHLEIEAGESKGWTRSYSFGAGE